MTSDALLTPLSFKSANQSLLDQKNGIGIELGHFIGLPASYKVCEDYFSCHGIALVDKGCDKATLDKECAKVLETTRIEKIDFLVTKSTYEFDQRWYWIGDFKRVFELANKRKIHLPLSDYLYDEILELLESKKG
jgi:hypothetical protein